MSPGGGALSARTVLEVADGLRWSDPRLGLSLAEHALHLAGDDAAARAAAQRCVIRSLAEVDDFEDIVSRATPLLEDAAVRQDRDDLAGLLVELAAAALGFGDDAVAGRLVAPVGPDEDLPARTRMQAALVRARLAGATGDVAGADRAAQLADAALKETAEPEAGLVRRDLARARAAARARSGDPAVALTIVSGVVSADPAADPDRGRRSLFAAADRVDLLLALGRADEALQSGRAALPEDAAPPVVRAAARIRLALAEHVHLAHGAHEEARSSARTAADQLEAAGHDEAAARAWEVVAAAAERGGDLAAALSATRHGHALEARSRARRDPALRALAMLAVSAPELPARPAPPAPPVPAPPVPAPPVPAPPVPAPVAPAPTAPEPAPAPLSEVESMLADARGSIGAPPAVDASSGLTPRRGHRHQATDDGTARPTGTETVPETLARLLGTTATAAGPDEHTENGHAGASPATGDGRRPEPADDRRAAPPASETDLRPTFDAFSTAPGGRTAGSGAPDRPAPGRRPAVPPDDRPDGLRPEPDEFPHIDPADPLGTATPREAAGPPADGTGAGRRGAPGDPGRDVGPAPRELPGPVVGDRASDGALEGASRRTRPGPPRPRPDDRDVPSGDDAAPGRRAASRPTPSAPTGGERDELDEELALTREGLLAEYHLPDAPAPPHQDDARAADVPVPSARRHVSGSMPLPPTDRRFAARPEDAPDRSEADERPSGGRAPRGENGARLADLLAEAMDAFRHTGPEENGWGHEQPTRGNGHSGRPGGDHGGPTTGRAEGPRGPGIGARRG